MQVTKHVHAIKIPFQITNNLGITVDRFGYAYLIYGKKVCLIDSGVASSEQVIFDYVKKTGRKPGDISMMVLTHSHPDHIGAARAIKRETGCTVAAHPGERSWIEDVELQLRERPVPNFHSLVGGPVDVDRILLEGDVLDLGDGIGLEVFHTPGHSKGSISLLLHEDKALFTGDAVPLAGDMPIYDDVLASVRSIKKLKDIGGIKVLLASWDDPREGDRVYQLLDEGLSYLQRIHEAVAGVAGEDFASGSMDLCKLVMGELGLPLLAANPLVARSFEANFEVIGIKNLLKD